jgi:tRNA-splicing ligase RtcB (3'-phosphate/5'-hydroxy nucleic acid ligase)
VATRSDPYQQRARELAAAAGLDPDAKIDRHGQRPMPTWCTFRQAAQDEQFGQRVAARGEPGPFQMLIEADNDLEHANIAKVRETFTELMRTPVIRAGAVMPDACPAGPLGTIPVGGVVSSSEIHPGFHSADICCSMAISVLGDVDPKAVLDAGMKISHFGPGGRPHSHDMQAPASLLAEFESNPFLTMIGDAAKKHFATQGDGNHFFFVGHLRSTGQVALVTHHGSRKPGAILHLRGMEVAERYRRKISPETLQQNAWIPADTVDGRNYWTALQLIRIWTKKNHFAIHDGVTKLIGARVKDRFWNEHNFIFQKSDGLFYHGKGATPAWPFFAPDATDLTLIPLNMGEPILIVRGKDNTKALGFSPHGAGRNLSRTAHMKTIGDRDLAEVFTSETKGIDARSYNGKTDLSELPSAYKDAASVRAQIIKFNLAEVVDEVMPYGNIMAGDVQSERRKARGLTLPRLDKLPELKQE